MNDVKIQNKSSRSEICRNSIFYCEIPNKYFSNQHNIKSGTHSSVKYLCYCSRKCWCHWLIYETFHIRNANGEMRDPESLLKSIYFAEHKSCIGKRIGWYILEHTKAISEANRSWILAKTTCFCLKIWKTLLWQP